MQIARLEHVVFDAYASNSPSSKVLLLGCKQYWENVCSNDTSPGWTWFLKAQKDEDEM